MRQGQRAFDLAVCHTYLMYAAGGLEEGLRVHQNYEILFEQSSRILDTCYCELMYQTHAKLMYLHATRNPSMPSSVMRHALEKFMRIFPANTIFLCLYIWNERRFTKCSVWSIVEDRLSDSGNTSSVFATLALLTGGRLEMNAVSINRRRNLYEKLVKHPR